LIWPECISNEIEATCIPTGTQVNALKRAKLLASLSSSDWHLLKILPNILLQSIKDKKAHSPESSRLEQGLYKTLDILHNHLPKKLRFDRVELTGLLKRPGYEHISFRVTNLNFGDYFHPIFEFRLGCANVTNERFGLNPKLEFPKQSGKQQLKSWFPESEDEIGQKLELRFALPGEMDLDVWNKLLISDKDLIRCLIECLEDLIELVSTSFQEQARPSSEWINMAQDMLQIFKKITN
jgi:hypothetical protein